MDEPVNGKRERIRDLLAQVAHLEKKLDEAESKCLTLTLALAEERRRNAARADR